MLNNHVQNPNRNNSQKNIHTFGRAVYYQQSKKDVTLEVKVAKIN